MVYLEPVLKVINKVLESPRKVLKFCGRKSVRTLACLQEADKDNIK